MALYVIAFSKDRPFQLLHALETCLSHVQAPSLHLVVIHSLTGSPQFASAYNEVAQAFPQATFVLEEEGRFFTQLQDLVSEASEKAGGIMWLVDDLLFYRDLQASVALDLLSTDETVWAVHPKLHPGITYSHTQDKAFSVPDLQWSAVLQEQGLVYTRAAAEGEWDYPWDLCGSIYRPADVRRLLSCLEGEYGAEGVNNPNKLEYLGNRLLRGAKGKGGGFGAVPPRCACWSRPVLSVVTVNRVQDTYDTPVYESGGGGEGASVEELEGLRRRGVRLDVAAYAEASWSFPSVHIGEWFTVRPDSVEDGQASSSSPPGVSVLLPVWNGEASVEAAVRSVLSQELLPGWSLEVVVVDDGSQDGSAAVVQGLADQDPRVRLVRGDGHRGLVAVLNQGWREARYDLIARMDADDVCLPGRLRAQLEYMGRHAECHVVGGGAVVFHRDDQQAAGAGVKDWRGGAGRVCVQPCHPRMLSWSLLFSCTVTHPSVLMRRDSMTALLPSGDDEGDDPPPVYDPQAFPAEDYDLWLRLAHGGEGRLANLPLLCVALGRHGDGVSSSRRAEQAAAAMVAAHRAVERVVGRRVEAEVVQAMRQPEAARSLGELERAAGLVLELLPHYVGEEGVGEGGRLGAMLVRRDAEARVKAMAAIGIAAYGPAAIAILAKSSAAARTCVT